MRQLRFLNDVANDAKSTQRIENYVIIARLKSESVGKLRNRIPNLRLLISSLPGSASLAMSTSILKALPGKLDIKRHSPSILYLPCNLLPVCDYRLYLGSTLIIIRILESEIILKSPVTICPAG